MPTQPLAGSEADRLARSRHEIPHCRLAAGRSSHWRFSCALPGGEIVPAMELGVIEVFRVQHPPRTASGPRTCQTHDGHHHRPPSIADMINSVKSMLFRLTQGEPACPESLSSANELNVDGLLLEAPELITKTGQRLRMPQGCSMHRSKPVRLLPPCVLSYMKKVMTRRRRGAARRILRMITRPTIERLQPSLPGRTQIVTCGTLCR